jgi:hypothetical protein
MTLRKATIILCPLDAAIWLLVAFEMFNTGSDPATKGLDEAAGYIVTALFVVTAAPARALTSFGRAANTALTLALAFPTVFAAMFIATVIAFA